MTLNLGGRSPYGERGLKYLRPLQQSDRQRRSPYGERGLKFGCVLRGTGDVLSLSLRRAWIEILTYRIFYGRTAVALLTESVD